MTLLIKLIIMYATHSCQPLGFIIFNKIKLSVIYLLVSDVPVKCIFTYLQRARNSSRPANARKPASAEIKEKSARQASKEKPARQASEEKPAHQANEKMPVS